MDDLERTPSLLTTRALGRAMRVLEETRSTMDDVRGAMERGAPVGTLVVAETQSAGRGTHGRAWSSPKGSDLYLSFSLRPALPLSSVGALTLAIGLAVADTVDEALGAPRARVKWVNDVLVARKKLAGILVESRSMGSALELVVVGIGLNCNREAFDGELHDRATSLRIERGAPLDRAATLARLLSHVEREVDALERGGVPDLVHRLEPRLAYVGEAVEIEGVRGVLRGLGERGELRLLTPEGDVLRVAGHLTPLTP